MINQSFGKLSYRDEQKNTKRSSNTKRSHFTKRSNNPIPVVHSVMSADESIYTDGIPQISATIAPIVPELETNNNEYNTSKSPEEEEEISKINYSVKEEIFKTNNSVKEEEEEISKTNNSVKDEKQLMDNVETTTVNTQEYQVPQMSEKKKGELHIVENELNSNKQVVFNSEEDER